MIFYKEERSAMFIDGANLYAAARGLGFDIDYKRLLEVFAGRGRLVRAFYYTALIENEEYSPIRPLVDWLDYNGYSMVTKPTKEFTDAFDQPLSHIYVDRVLPGTQADGQKIVHLGRVGLHVVHFLPAVTEPVVEFVLMRS